MFFRNNSYIKRNRTWYEFAKQQSVLFTSQNSREHHTMLTALSLVEEYLF